MGIIGNTYKSIRRPPKRSPHYFAFMGAGGILLRWPMLVYGSVSSWSGSTTFGRNKYLLFFALHSNIVALRNIYNSFTFFP
jgi:hypothetical protein